MLHIENNFRKSRSGLAVKVAAITFFSALSAGLASLPATAQQSGQDTSQPAGTHAKQSRQHALQPGQETFHSAGAAAKALIAAVKADDQSSLLKILGPEGKDIVSSGDPVEDKNNRAEFAKKYDQMHRLITEPDGTTTLYIGAENWPTPIHLDHQGKSWYFDTAGGKQEILYRRVGRNELNVIEVCHQLVNAEKEYYGQQHDGNSENQYAQKFHSDPGKHNGLYWEASAGESESPIGPLMASAAAEGYSPEQKHQPFHGYYFRILKAQKGPQGSKSFIDDGKMTKGFAFLAYPAEYRSSGVMTFIVDQDGIVYEKDLGRRTPEVAKTLNAYSRDATWRKAE